MLLEENPATRELHNDWRQRISAEFPDIDFSRSSDFLSIINYIDFSPQKFYSKEAFKKYLQFLDNVKIQDPVLLSDIFKESESFLNISNTILAEINQKPIHDILLPEEHNYLINFIDKEIHYNLLKLYERPFFNFALIVAKHSRIKRGKGTDGLDLYNVIEELKGGNFGFLSSVYFDNIRNGIAHGKVIFTDADNIYIDKKGNKEQIRTRRIVDIFDNLVDITNGFCLAFKAFCFTNPDYFEKYNISIPQSILIEELQAKSNAPGWTITNCLESVALQDKRQIIIYVKNDNWDFSKVQWYCFSTAYWAERLTKSHDRIFFSLNSKHSLNGWAAFDGKMLKELREQNETRIEAYSRVLQGNLIFFAPRIKFPRIIYKIGTYISVLKTTFPLHWRKYLDTYFPNPFYVRDTQIHSKGKFAVVQDPSVIIKPNFQNDIEQLIKANYKKIVRLAIKKPKKQCSPFSLTKYLPVKYIRVFIYDTDKRVRNLRNSGLIPELVATVEVNTTRRIKTIDIINGTPEQHGKYRIVWHNRWQGK